MTVIIGDFLHSVSGYSESVNPRGSGNPESVASWSRICVAWEAQGLFLVSEVRGDLKSCTFNLKCVLTQVASIRFNL